jgi:hypothetical protein
MVTLPEPPVPDEWVEDDPEDLGDGRAQSWERNTRTGERRTNGDPWVIGA